ncbi:MAG: hypothetical protein JSW23_08275, partial [Planctomycetota bacterium]
ADRVAAVEPTWTPVLPGAIPVATLALGPAAQPTSEVVDMVFMMMADGKIEKDELGVVVKLGMALGFNPDRIRTVIENIVLQALCRNERRGPIIVDTAWGQVS